MDKILENSGVSGEAYMPPELHRPPPWNLSLATKRQESEMVIFNLVERLLQDNSLHPHQVDVLVVNCSVFCPTPSLSAMVVNKFGMRPDIITYNLAGMGCSAGLISVSLVRELLQVYPGRRALVVSTENISQNVYLGNQRSMSIPCCIFRMGGAALLMSNCRADARRAKQVAPPLSLCMYELLHVVRTHMGAHDEAYRCVYQQEDDAGIVGMRLEKALMQVAGMAVRDNLTRLGPKVLPFMELLRFAANHGARRLLTMDIPVYLPDFNHAFDHFCIHTGGKGVLEAMEKQLGLTPEHMWPSKYALWRYGNTSSSSIWYVLACIETQMVINRGDRVWQLAFGSGFKANSAVWRARRTVHRHHEAFLPPRENSSFSAHA
ncbi:g4759 [Coccomyxa elongata]